MSLTQHKPHRRHPRRRSDDRGEASSWLLVGAALAAAAVFASIVMSSVTAELAAKVAAAADVSVASDVPAAGPGAALSSGELTLGGELGLGDGSASTILLNDGTIAVMRKGPDGRMSTVTIGDDGMLQVVHVDVDGTIVLAQSQVTGDEDSGWRLGEWHFEDRAELNVDLPEHIDDIGEGDGWTQLPASQSVLHDDKSTPDPEIKFIHTDGREAVYNPETGELVTDPRYAGTYNYVNPAPVPDSLTDIGGWLSWTFRGIGHVIADMIPYGLVGNVRGSDAPSGGSDGPLGHDPTNPADPGHGYDDDWHDSLPDPEPATTHGYDDDWHDYDSSDSDYDNNGGNNGGDSGGDDEDDGDDGDDGDTGGGDTGHGYDDGWMD